MNSTASLCQPRNWLTIGKYLIPIGMDFPEGKRNPSPRQQVCVAQLATEHADRVLLEVLGESEVLPKFPYPCYSSGEREVRSLPTKFAAPSFVASLKNGLSFGRHCCVIDPDGKAVRETGFNLDGEVLSNGIPMNRWRLKYWRRRWEGDVTTRPWLPPKQRLDARVAVLNTRFSHNYYHWLIDILPRLIPLQNSGTQVDYYLVDCVSAFQRTVFTALGIHESQLIQPHCRLLLEAEQLLVPSLPSPACLREFGKLLLARLGADGQMASRRRTFISRRKTGTRTLSNEMELEALLQAHGFETHFLEDYTLAQQARLIHVSEIIVATHGAGLANLLFARPQTHVIEIVPAGRYNATCYPEKSRIFGLHHQLLFAERARYKQVLHVAIEDLELALLHATDRSHRAAA